MLIDVLIPYVAITSDQSFATCLATDEARLSMRCSPTISVPFGQRIFIPNSEPLTILWVFTRLFTPESS
jgi:hypothetical protein